MEKEEPKIYSNMNDTELFEWMAGKVSATRELRAALAERIQIQQALLEIEEKVLLLTRSASIELLSREPDPIQHHQFQ